jgi:hypothetical protein
MSGFVPIALSFTAMISTAIGIDYINRATRSNKVNKSVKGYKRIKVSGMSKKFLILLLLVSLAGLLYSIFAKAKSAGVVNQAQAKYANYKAAKAGTTAAAGMPPSPVVPPAP